MAFQLAAGRHQLLDAERQLGLFTEQHCLTDHATGMPRPDPARAGGYAQDRYKRGLSTWRSRAALNGRA
jgi:hypothetical protein